MHHCAVTTVEGIGSTQSRLHNVQKALVENHGSQCGFCTPGIVMSMYTLIRNVKQPTEHMIERALQAKFHNFPYQIKGLAPIFFKNRQQLPYLADLLHKPLNV